jgi:hypothetical protein
MPKDVSYKQAQAQHEKALNEAQAKRMEADRIRTSGAQELADYEALARSYSTNLANFSGDATYASLAGDVQRQRLYAENKGKKFANSQFYSAPVANKKNVILDTEFNLAKNSVDKVYAQSELTRILSSGDQMVTDSVSGVTVRFDQSTQYDAIYKGAVAKITDIDSEIAGNTETIEKTKGGLETLMKDPLYAKDAKIDASIKTAKANKP